MLKQKFTIALTATCLASVQLLGCTKAPDAGTSNASKRVDTEPAAIVRELAAAVREPDETGDAPTLAASDIAHVTITESFVTPATPGDNVDSPALWVGRDGRSILLATAKATARLMVYDGETGTPAGHVGSPGTRPGQFDRPNGIFIADDFLFVVERDNRRVQVLRLPGYEPLGSFGAGELKKPYGLWVRSTGKNRYEVLVTDAYMDGPDAQGEDVTPPLSALGARVKRYAVDIRDGQLQAKLVDTFGDTTEAGAIRIPESVWGDPANARLLISEEDTATGTALREYGLDGKFRGRTFGLGLFKAQAEGIALWSCADGSGYWIATDQFLDRSLFHVFDRQTLRHLGAFAGNTVANTDGIWLHMGATKRFPQGVFYAVHDDQAVGAFDWRDIARGLSLREHCAR
jgi:3-phytase